MISYKIPTIIQRIPITVTWNIPNNNKEIYLTFDDGPTVDITFRVLSMLDDYNAKATFFCLGKNAEQNPYIYKKIIEDGHSVGNHSYSHLNGWNTGNKEYFEDVQLSRLYINSKLYRPPYGRIKPSQIGHLKKQYKIIMWDVLSGDYNYKISEQKCINNVLNNVKSGSIIVFHDSVKAQKKLLYTLPFILKELTSQGYVFKGLI